MKRIIILLFFPVCTLAQVSMTADPVDFISPGDNQLFLSVEFISHEPVRIDECTIEFDDDFVFDFVDRLYLYQDDAESLVLSDAAEFLTNPWVNHPSAYVGIDSDTSIILNYHLDSYQHYANNFDLQFSCRLNYYSDVNMLDTVIGPVNISSEIILEIENKIPVDILKVINIKSGLFLDIKVRLCEPINIISTSGVVLKKVYKSEKINLESGIYILHSEIYGYIGTYVVI